MRSTLCVASLCFLSHLTLSAQPIARAFVGDDHKAHLNFANGSTKVVPPSKQQVDCGEIKVAEDGHTVAWLMLIENCCTSYPIPTSLVVYRNGKQRMVTPGQMILQWHFVDKGARIALLSGPVHGWPVQAVLYTARNGKVTATWDGKGQAPEWADSWKDQFEPQEEEESKRN